MLSNAPWEIPSINIKNKQKTTGSKFSIVYKGLNKIQKLKNITECPKFICFINLIML